MTDHQRYQSPLCNRECLWSIARHPAHLQQIASRVVRPVVLFAIVFGPLAGCSTIGDIVEIEAVKPWQRGALAREDMQLNSDALRQSVDDHIYFSKEASTGGSNVQGGGCGCN